MRTKKNATPAPEKDIHVHYTAPYLIDPQHPVTINVIGCGGTGSQVIYSLGRMHAALRGLGHPGLFVRAIDPDKVTLANMGRQLFSESEVGYYKAACLVGTVNRRFKTDWECVPMLYTKKSAIKHANITISCVDSGMARFEIVSKLFEKKPEPKYSWERKHVEPYERPYYWMDFGNMKDRGQCVIGTIVPIEQPKESAFTCHKTLRSVHEIHPDILKDIKGEDQGPSCSLAEALEKQDLFINTNLANEGLDILWLMFRDLRIKRHGCYVNLEDGIVNPLMIG